MWLLLASWERQSDSNDVNNPHNISKERAASPHSCNLSGGRCVHPGKVGWAQTGALWLTPHPPPRHRQGTSAAAPSVQGHIGHTTSSTFWENPGPSPAILRFVSLWWWCREMYWSHKRRIGRDRGPNCSRGWPVQYIIRACASSPSLPPEPQAKHSLFPLNLWNLIWHIPQKTDCLAHVQRWVDIQWAIFSQTLHRFMSAQEQCLAAPVKVGNSAAADSIP